MSQGSIVVLDVGKTLSKLTMWSPDRRLLDRRSRSNQPQSADGYAALDVQGITDWLADTLQSFARENEIAAIIPVAHGAAACVHDTTGGHLPPMDYEAEPPAGIRHEYERLRDPFALTGSPRLPAGLNLGCQLHWLDTIAPTRRGQIVTWPQHWAWLLSGVAATEVTSLGSHTDLWCPRTGGPSPLAVRQGWARRLAPLRRASDVLGPVTEAWRTRCGLPSDCVVLCGLHDSNAALLGARLHPQIGGREFTVLSTGTWFVAMRSPGTDAAIDLAALPQMRDCLVNVDMFGTPVPSSRFMGGREAELIEAASGALADPASHMGDLLYRAERLMALGTFVLPSFQHGVGPFPNAAGQWIGTRAGGPDDPLDRRAAVSLYLALLADTSLDLIGSKERLVVEGRFAGDAVFTRALAALRPRQALYTPDMTDAVPHGALHLFRPDAPPPAAPIAVEPLPGDVIGYARRWRTLVQDEAAKRTAPA